MEEERATHSSILAGKIPWIEEPGRLQSMRSHRVGLDRTTEHTHRIISHKHPQSHSGTQGLTFLLFEGIAEDRSEVSLCVLLLLCQGFRLLQVTKNANTWPAA